MTENTDQSPGAILEALYPILLLFMSIAAAFMGFNAIVAVHKLLWGFCPGW